MAQQKFHIPLDVCYGSLSLFTSVIHNVFLLYHVDVFVSVYKIDKASFWLGEAVFLLWNSFNDPLFGWMSDRQYLSGQSSHKGCHSGQSSIIQARLAALRWNGPLFALSFFTFWISWLYPSVQFVVCLCLYDSFLTMVDLHHNALLADLAVSAESRTRLNSRCSIFSALGSASVFLSYTVWNKTNLTSFRYFCALLTIFSILGFFFSVRLLQRAFTKSKKSDEWMEIQPRTAEHQLWSTNQAAGLKSFVKQLLSQKNFLWFSCMNLIQVFHCHFNSNFFPLFLENLLGSSISPAFGSFLIGMSFVAPHINNLYFLSLCRRYGVYTVIRVLFMVKLSISLLMLAMGPHHVWLLCLYIASNRVFTEGTCKLLSLVISDLVDEDYVLHQRSQAVSALIFGTAALLSKPGQTLAPLLGTWLLSMQTGHDIFSSGKEVGTIKMDMSRVDETTATLYRQGCFQLLIYTPIVCAILQLFIWSRFNLHGDRLRWIKSVRAGAQSSTV